MKVAKRALRLSIFLGEGDNWRHRPTYVEIVRRAHKAGLAGASVLRGIEGYGASSHIHAQHVFLLREHLPLLVVIVDSEEKIRAFLDRLDDLEISGLVVVDEIESIRYVASEPKRTHWWSSM